MTEKQSFLRRQLLAKIHIHPAHKELKRLEAWEEWLEARFGARSAGELSIKELIRALDALNGRDVAITRPDFYGRASLKGRNATSKQKICIFRLGESLGWSDEGLRGFVAHQISRECDANLASLSEREASKVITGLKAIIAQRAQI